MSKSMSKSYKKRIAKTIRAGIWLFMSLCIFYKLLFYSEDWLLDPIVITISFSSGYFVFLKNVRCFFKARGYYKRIFKKALYTARKK